MPETTPARSVDIHFSKFRFLFGSYALHFSLFVKIFHTMRYLQQLKLFCNVATTKFCPRLFDASYYILFTTRSLNNITMFMQEFIFLLMKYAGTSCSPKLT